MPSKTGTKTASNKRKRAVRSVSSEPYPMSPEARKAFDEAMKKKKK